MDEITQETDPCGKATLKEAHREKEATMEPANDCDEMEKQPRKMVTKAQGRPKRKEEEGQTHSKGK